MQSLYELLKASKGLPVSDSYAALWAKKAESGIKTFTGRLPLFFRTSERKLRDWVIYGNNSVGKNLLEITAVSLTINGVVFTVDKQAGTVTANKENMTTATSSMNYHFYLPPGDYIFTCDDDAQRDITYDSYVRITNATLARDNNNDAPGNSFTWGGGNVFIYHRIQRAYAENEHTFKPMIRKAGTSEAFEPYKVGVGKKTKNLLEITEESQTIHGVIFTVDKQAGTVTATRESASSSDAILAIEIPDEVKGQNLYFSGCPSEGSANTYNVYTVDYNTTLRALQWDGTTPTATDYGTSNNEVRYVEGHRSQIRLRVKAGYDAQNVVFKPMLRPANTTSDFIPYGYQIPLDVRDGKTGEYNYAYDIFIGEFPLTEGESISKSSTGIDIRTIADQENYPNILTTALTNKPEMMIKYKTNY